MLSRSNVLSYEKGVAGTQNPGSLEAKLIPYGKNYILPTNKGLKAIDWHLCTITCGTYLSQGLLINILFLIIANISQMLQNQLEIDTSNLLHGKFSGILTVSIGSFLSYRISELIFQYVMKRYNNDSSLKRLYEVIVPNKACLYCVQLPVNIVNRLTSFLQSENKLKQEAVENIVDSENTRVKSEKLQSTKRQLLKREIAVISAYSLATFLLLGGNEITHPGAYAMPKLSLEANGYKYATKAQKRTIQKVGKTYGCHTCGYISQIERYIADHQPPSGVVKQRLKGKYISFLLKHNLVPLSLVKPKQHFYPQCIKCSQIQSRIVRKRQFVTHSLIPRTQAQENNTLLDSKSIPTMSYYIFRYQVCISKHTHFSS
ncbi:conserved hypothetical protein [Theileria equi strain WA]|uniref:Uncharacterized protein n=1 Tax=Theileria equi strain WA TaxID=1537102 RepID=L1LFZ1_THEEQ|nr:conserved hypothetical protein [Theileria equi strain WA]EKX74347.1 conserved hypothetical protein [Theileria equi strain WA]|eukprot:XP_004833799.1 conserved hypothetical protein [Theileria equi strain WA]